ncbi:MAG: (2Fe-2S)-binding protein [Hydrocarboniphaga sp.]|uniref:2Fe-2S iron-sulfur cluster-binding protein n=1 Tax=Hydrocarboniphaga sp. TaxID=2033016 RepID=UPI00260466D7|nr:2Fe-2S iron-sulfur cluster-binding protein [Hydrocarboniphaga sp.]MDB5971438.1 (2Fe-2S)-binding protein [Hydrocarboniphaga sp.]
MPKVVFVEHSGKAHTVEGAAGQSLMQVAVDHMIPGIIADCGGSASCGTCHGYVQEPWNSQLAPADDTEQSMLDGVLYGEANSRLTCQIRLSEELDGIEVRLPKSQI